MMRNGAAEVYYLVKVKEQLRELFPEDFCTEEKLKLKHAGFGEMSTEDQELVIEEAQEEKRIADEAAGTVYNLNILIGLGSGNVIALILGYVNEWMGGESI